MNDPRLSVLAAYVRLSFQLIGLMTRPTIPYKTGLGGTGGSCVKKIISLGVIRNDYSKYHQDLLQILMRICSKVRIRDWVTDNVCGKSSGYIHSDGLSCILTTDYSIQLLLANVRLKYRDDYC